MTDMVTRTLPPAADGPATADPVLADQALAAAHIEEVHPAPPGHSDVPMAVTGRYLPGLDGLRAVAMVAVLFYHLGFGWASGFYLSIDLFFVLSGFLITTLLLEERARTGGIGLGGFYSRRARRLLPGLFLAVSLVALYVVLNGRYGPAGSGATVDLSGLRGDALATLFYVANWHAIVGHESYWAQYAAQSPLKHTWTLAIEEQFYLVWPPMLVAMLAVVRRWGGHWRRVGLAVAVVAALASAAAMAGLFHGGDPSRVYYGTDTRAFDLFAGIALAFVVAARPQPGPRGRRALHLAGPLAAVALAAFWTWSAIPASGGMARPFMYRGGFLLCAGLAAVVIADVRQVDRGPLGRLLSFPLLVWLGMISYGLYLYHWPVIIFMTPARTGLSGVALAAARIALTVALAAASYYLVEKRLRRAWLAGWQKLVLAPAAAVAIVVAVVVATLPAVAAPTGRIATTAVAPAGGVVPGSGGYADQVPVRLPPGRVVSPADPLRVLLIGDSVMYVNAPGLTAALQATGEVQVTDVSAPGWGLSTDPHWRTSFPVEVAQYHPDVVLASWSWDDAWAEAHPAAYQAELETALRLFLAPGDGVAGVLFPQFPPSGPFYDTVPHAAALTATRTAQQAAWDRLVRRMPSVFPGQVMYLPVASSILLAGRYSDWLPPADQPQAPRADWVRVRFVDRVHLCAPGVVRYSTALLSDLTDLFHLAPAKGRWYAGSWTESPRTPAGMCPDDHPPG